VLQHTDSHSCEHEAQMSLKSNLINTTTSVGYFLTKLTVILRMTYCTWFQQLEQIRPYGLATLNLCESRSFWFLYRARQKSNPLKNFISLKL